MDFFVYFLIFIFGISIGSFLNSVIYRLEINQSPFFGRSFCPSCHHQLSWFDLIPILSFLLLKGKCRYCQKPISIQYPLIEISTGLIFLLIFNFSAIAGSDFDWQFTVFDFLTLIYYWIITSFLIIIFVYDLKHSLIPEIIVYFAIAVIFFYRLFEIFLSNDLSFIALTQAENLMLGILPALFFLALIVFSQEKWMGWGDFQLAILMGLFLGWPKIFIALFFAFFFGALTGIILILIHRKNLKSQIPFGPFLICGTFFSLFFGEKIINLLTFSL